MTPQENKRDWKEMPRVGVYLTPKEFNKVVENHEALKSVMEKGEEPIVLRVDGKIGYHDLQGLLKAEREKVLGEVEEMILDNVITIQDWGQFIKKDILAELKKIKG